ncbi:iron donor protein CyaY [Neisseriaceae bacterium TC5R-5]|nr:iron donor protein CyaY [Neisseriaceae bacterium TC5R-5]
MNESQFLDLSDAIFKRIESAIDDHAIDADGLISGNVMELEFADGGKIIINRHTANQELWIAAKSGGYHFSHQAGQWIASRDGAEFFQTLSTAIETASGQPCPF